MEMGQEELEELKNIMEAGMSQFVDVAVTLSNNDQYFEAVARCYRRTYISLIHEGFSPNEALEIVKSLTFTGK